MALQVTQTNIVCRVGKATPLSGSREAAVTSAAAAAPKAAPYKYSKPGTAGQGACMHCGRGQWPLQLTEVPLKHCQTAETPASPINN